MTLYKDKIKIKGGQVPEGTVTVSGAKNSATRLLAAATLCDEPVRFSGYPTTLVDSRHKERFLNCNGVITTSNSKSELNVDPTHYTPKALDDYFYPIRTTYLLVAGQLKRGGKAYIPYPGGCNIGARKYDVHISVWEAFGCEVDEIEECIVVTAPSELVAANFEFPISTVGGTENAILMGAIAKGESVFENAYITPEIEDLIGFLRRTGVKIDVIGQSYIKVTGRDFLKGVEYNVLPDRIEALTWIVYAALSKGTITIKNVPFKSMELPLMYIKSAGVDFFQNDDSIHISPDCLKDGKAHSFEVACGTYPGIISDMQPFYVLLGLTATGKSRIHDYRYPERITYVEELQKHVSKNIEYSPGKITTNGPVEFLASESKATDLRGTMASVLAALCAKKGTSEILGVSMALRGYDELVTKLNDLGIDVEYFD
ncbi:UDP-N-acetylglucosamine 1-carboxyvinyltransferase [Vibrio astriarenae]